MQYVVLVRAHANAPWEPFADPCGDPFAAMRQIQVAGKTHPEVTVVQAEDAEAVRVLLDQMRQGTAPSANNSPMPSLTATPSVRVEDVSVERLRWEMEQGNGGDHDCTYTFSLPPEMTTLGKWLALMSRHRTEIKANISVA